MGEYGREQRNQLSRAIANGEVGSRQLKKFVDHRDKFTDDPIQEQRIGLNVLQRTLITALDTSSSDLIDNRLEELRNSNLEITVWFDLACEYAKQQEIKGAEEISNDYFLSKIYSIQEFKDDAKAFELDEHDTVTVTTHGDSDGNIEMNQQRDCIKADDFLKNLRQSIAVEDSDSVIFPLFCSLGKSEVAREIYKKKGVRIPAEDGTSIGTKDMPAFYPNNIYDEPYGEVVESEKQKTKSPIFLILDEGGATRRLGNFISVLTNEFQEEYGRYCPNFLSFYNGDNDKLIPALQETYSVICGVEQILATAVTSLIPSKENYALPNIWAKR